MKKKIAILMGGISEENYLSLRSGENIFNHMDKDRYDIQCVKWFQDGTFSVSEINKFDKVKNKYFSLNQVINSFGSDLIFNVLHGNFEGDGRFSGLLELLTIPYTGNRFYASVSGMNKYISKLFFKYLNIKTPGFIFLNKNNLNLIREFSFPCIIKPVSSGSSVGTRKIRNLNSALIWVKDLFYNGFQDIIVEEYISGKEYSVGIIGKYDEPDNNKIILPVGCIEYDSDIFDDTCKFNNEYKTIIPSGLSNFLEKKMEKVSLEIHNFFKFSGISRTDFLVRDDEVYLLEVNTHPGLASHSIIPSMIEKSTVTLSWVIDFLIENAY